MTPPFLDRALFTILHEKDPNGNDKNECNYTHTRLGQNGVMLF